MKKVSLKMIFIFFTVTGINYNFSQTYILCTAALRDLFYGQRKEEYINCFSRCKEFGFEPYIVEALNPFDSHTFLNDYSNHVLYMGLHKTDVEKGIHEARSIIAAIDYFNFKNEDMVIKLTGRYFLDNHSFLKTVQSSKNSHINAFVSFKNDLWADTGLFAMRVRDIKKMYNQKYRDGNMFLLIENLLAKYVKLMPKDTTMNIGDLGLKAVIFGDGSNYNKKNSTPL